jgi:hypothetical protein
VQDEVFRGWPRHHPLNLKVEARVDPTRKVLIEGSSLRQSLRKINKRRKSQGRGSIRSWIYLKGRTAGESLKAGDSHNRSLKTDHFKYEDKSTIMNDILPKKSRLELDVVYEL